MIYDVKATNPRTGDTIDYPITGDTEAKCLMAAKRKADEIFPSGREKIFVQLTRPQRVIDPEKIMFRKG